MKRLIVIPIIAGFLSLALASAGHAMSEDVKCVQGQLAELGYYSDTIDGKIGRNTRAAAASYLSDMKADSDVLDLPSIDPNNAELWCYRVAAVHPAAVPYLEAYHSSTGAAALSIMDVRVQEGVVVDEPFAIQVQYSVSDGQPYEIEAVCFSLEFYKSRCFNIAHVRHGWITVFTRFIEPGSFTINVAVRFSSGSRTQMTGWTTFVVDVAPEVIIPD